MSRRRRRVTPVRRPDQGATTSGRLARLTVAVLLVVGVSVGAAASATAETPLPVTGISVNQNDGPARQAIQISRLYPGSQQQAVLLLDGYHPELTRRMELTVTSLTDVENGCVHPETGSGDTTCGDTPGQGELSQFLDVTLTAGREGESGGHRTCQPVGVPVSTTLTGLAQTPVVVGLPGGDGTLCVIAVFAHRDSPRDNVTQTDVVRFDLRLRFDTLAVPTPTATGSPTATPSSPATPPTPATDASSPTVTGSPTSGGDQPTVGGGSGGDNAAGGSADGGDDAQVEGVKFERPVVVSRVERGPRAELGALPRTGTWAADVLIIAVTVLGIGTVMVAVVRGRRRPEPEAVS